MPIQRCQKDGKLGWQYGNQHCYIGPDAKKKAIRQMQAIKVSESKGKQEFVESMSYALDYELALINAIAEIELPDEKLDLALAGHGHYKYSCGHYKVCRCYHSNMEFNVSCFCPECFKEE